MRQNDHDKLARLNGLLGPSVASYALNIGDKPAVDVGSGRQEVLDPAVLDRLNAAYEFVDTVSNTEGPGAAYRYFVGTMDNERSPADAIRDGDFTAVRSYAEHIANDTLGYE